MRGTNRAFMNIGSDNQYVNVQSFACNTCSKIRDKHVITAIHNMIFKAQEFPREEHVRHSGDNGKSTLMALMGTFFGEYGSSNGTKFLTKGAFARSRDDHDAGLKPMKGREHEFERRDDLADILPTWRSALAQLLIEHFRRPGRSSIFDTLPVAMTEWKSGIADSANPLAEWLEEVVEVTGASSDAVWIGTSRVGGSVPLWTRDIFSISTKLVKAFCLGKQGTSGKRPRSRDILTRGAIAMVMIVVTIAIAVGIRGLVLAKDRDIVAVTLQQSDAGKEFGNIRTDDKRSVLTRLIALMAFWGVLGDFLSGVLIATFAIYRIGDTIQVKDVMESYPDVDFTRIKADILGKYKENGAGGVQVVVFDMTNFGTDVRIVYPVVKLALSYAQDAT
eukprot:gene10532-biopygen4942